MLDFAGHLQIKASSKFLAMTTKLEQMFDCFEVKTRGITPE